MSLHDDGDGARPHPLAGLPVPWNVRGPEVRSVPDDGECFRLWDKYAMLPNVRRHSLIVAHIATMLAERAFGRGMPVDVAEVRASALLHDIAKTYSVLHGGSHAQIGASWTVIETGSRILAQGVMMHVFWPWKLPDDATICSLPLFVLYADKRVRHDVCVSLDERYEDLLVRYGRTAEAKKGILRACRQGKRIEDLFAEHLDWSPDDIPCPEGIFDQPCVTAPGGEA
ncbi:MAG: HDIG domain-containing protein [Desulfovibrio sp.]|jgi:putative nucleotidyltransferase with HDIG domain|nr:HDIG domain-containing protein [Desulfovibrio sp.]